MPRDELRRLAKQLNKKQKPTIRPERATLVRIGDDGTAYVHFDGGVDETPAIMAMDANIGDTVTVWRSGGRCIINGNTTSPADVAKPMAIRAQRAAVNAQVKANTTAQELEAEKARIGHLEADSAEITELVAQKATIADLQAAEGRISDLESDHVSTTDLTAVNGEIDNLKAKDVTIEGNITAATGRIGTIEADYLKAADMQAETARVDNLLAKKATVNDLNAATGRISVLESTKANISDLEANYITADDIEATYMHADMSNSDVAWIQNGVIANGAISSAMINDVSANKLTAGTINGSVINVTNLNADNITTGTINGQRIGEGSLSLDKLSEDVYTEAEVDAKLSTMQSQIDGAIETWTGTDVPTLNNAPASAWTTAADRDKHVGDVYFNTQTGYNYRFTKSGSTYSWLQIKDTDITNALQRIQTAEGQITQFDSDISTLKTDTGELKTKTQSLETSLGDKVDTTTFNELEDTVDGHSQTISQHTTAISNKADTSTVNQVTNRVTKAEQDISGINTTIGELQATVEGKADGSTVTTISNKLNTVSDTVDGHTQTLSSVQSTLSTKADNSTVSTLRSEYNETKTTVSGHETRLTATESVANGVRADFDNLEIGGRNLLRGSAVLGAMGTTHGWFHNGGTPSLDTVDGIECIKVVSTTASALIASARTASRVNLEWGQTYIASCWLMFNEDINNNFGDNTPLHFHAGSVATTNVFDLAIRSHGGGVTTYEVEPDESYGNTIPANTWVRFVRKIVTADSAPNADYPYPVFAPLIYGPLRKATTSDEHITWIRGFKVERGTVPTAWTPAPEDLETEVTSLKTDYAAYKQTTTEALSEIGTTYATKTELGTETSNRQTAIQQVNDAISLKANSSDVYTKTQTDGLISTEVTNRNAAITAKADEITSSVSETYATKDSVSGIDTRLTTAESSITQQAGQIAIKANAADVNTKAETTALLEVKANKATLTSEINASADTVKIDATRVNIEGAAIFTSGRLSQSSLDGAYDASGAASAAQAAAISAAAADATSKANAAQAAAEATAAADATSKANAAQTAATNAANQATDQKLTSYSTTSQMNDAIGDAVDGLDFDSTNLLKNARKMALGAAADQSIGRWRRAGNSNMAKSRVEIEDGPYGPCGALQLSGTQEVTTDTSCFGMDSFVFPENNRVYEMSIYARVISGEGYAGILTGGYGKATVDVGNTTENWGTSVYRVRKLTSDWQRIWVRFRITAIANNLYIGGAGTDATIQICMARITEATATLPQAVKRTQRIYWRSASSLSSWSMPTSWLTVGNDGSHQFGKWTTKVPRMTANADGTGTKYPYLYTCEQREMADGTLAYTTVLLDDSATIIDGGNIITGSVAANKLDVYDATIQKIRADAIDTSSITIGQGQVTGLTNALAGKQPTGDYATKAQAQGYADAKDTAIADAAKTATNYITEITGGGVSVHDASDSSDYMQITASGMDVYNDGVNVARFGADGAQVGVADGLHTHVDEDSFDMFTDAQESSSIFHVGYPTGATVTDTFVGDGTTTEYMLSNTPSEEPVVTVTVDGVTTTMTIGTEYTHASVSSTTIAFTSGNTPVSGAVIKVSYPTAAYIPYYTLGVRSGNAGEWSVAEGHETEAPAYSAHAEGSSSRALGDASHAEGENTTAYGATSHAEGYETSAYSVREVAPGVLTTQDSFGGAHAEGQYTEARGEGAHAEGSHTNAHGEGAHAEGKNTSAVNHVAHAEGHGSVASGTCSHAEGSGTTASSSNSHAEGGNTVARGFCAHAEGYQTTASGWLSHAEGGITTASGQGSHAQNIGTVSARDAQTVIGTYNSEDTATTTTHPNGDSDYGEYALVIGNGTGDDNRSNALTTDWNGYTRTGADAYKVLWKGALFMHGTQTITLSENISEQGHGIVLVWSRYDTTNRVAKDEQFTYSFIPKYHVALFAGKGVACPISTPWGKASKYLYVSDASITGHEWNDDTRTVGNVTDNNGAHVLRAVIGV